MFYAIRPLKGAAINVETILFFIHCRSALANGYNGTKELALAENCQS